LEEKIYSKKANHIFGSSRSASKNHNKFLFRGNYGLEIHTIDFLRPTKNHFHYDHAHFERRKEGL